MYELQPGKLYYNKWQHKHVVVVSCMLSEVNFSTIVMLEGKKILTQYYDSKDLRYYFGEPL